MSSINYSQCWEDIDLLKTALKVKSDDVIISITSGGDNSLALLLCHPKKLFLIDINPAQNYLTELKLQAPKVLEYKQYLELLGVHDTEFRASYFKQVSQKLSVSAGAWFMENMNVIEKGIIHSGKFEKYLNAFRKYILPMVQPKSMVIKFVKQANLTDQITFYEKNWNTWRWQLFFNIATNPSLLGKFARQKGAKQSSDKNDNQYFKRLEQIIYRNLLKTNHYLSYALIGEYGESLPDYLLEKNYSTLQGLDASSYEFRCDDLLNFLKNTPNDYLTKYNLSDAFEFIAADEAVKIWVEIIRTAKKGAIVSYWCNQHEYVPPPELNPSLVCNTGLEAELKEQDKLYFYKSFHIYSILK
jgi:S-adenosylmethionine-diacylglycerol 3-amino-3-carboxypropyl transferase